MTGIDRVEELHGFRIMTSSVLVALLFVIGVYAAFAQSAPATSVANAAEQIVENFRRTIVLHESAERSRVLTQAGQYLFFHNRLLVAQLVDNLLQAPREERDQQIVALLDLIDSRKDWRDMDRLALLGVVNETRLRLPAGLPIDLRLNKVREALVAIRAADNREFTAVLAERRGRGAERAAWRMDRRRSADQDGAAYVRRRPASAIYCRDSRILDHYGVKAIFFQVGQNLGVRREGRAVVSRNIAVVAAILRAGHAIANHTYTHPFLSRLDLVQVADEIDTTQDLLAAAAPERGRAPLFRPPYGARNSLVLGEVADRGLRSVLWNIDSRDWADPIPRSIAQRVIGETEREGRGVILFHDIHGRTVQALSIVIAELVKRGFRFAYWDGTRLAVDATP